MHMFSEIKREIHTPNCIIETKNTYTDRIRQASHVNKNVSSTIQRTVLLDGKGNPCLKITEIKKKKFMSLTTKKISIHFKK